MKAIKVLKNPSIGAVSAILLNLAQAARADIICQKKGTIENIFVAMTLTPTDGQHPLETPVVAVLNTGRKKISLTGSMENIRHRLHGYEQYSLKDSEGNDVNVHWVTQHRCQYTRPGCDANSVLWERSLLEYEGSEFEITCQDFTALN